MSRFRQFMLWGLLICALPIALAFAAVVAGGLFGCTVNEGGGSACLVAGIDLGAALSQMFVLHWFGLMTLPIAALLIVVWILAELVSLFRRKA